MKHMLPPLPYDYAALEPHIDARTMTLHHDQYHASYVANLNSALEKFPEWHERTALWLLLNLSKLPDKARTAVRNNAGGHVNHSLFWQVMAPAAGAAPAGPLAEAIDRDFGGLEQFKARFDEAGGKLFGSGWGWLARTQQDGGAHRRTGYPERHRNPEHAFAANQANFQRPMPLYQREQRHERVAGKVDMPDRPPRLIEDLAESQRDRLEASQQTPILVAGQARKQAVCSRDSVYVLMLCREIRQTRCEQD
jgi:superoxide dismutase